MNKIFFLGGSDLEMLTIRELLIQENQRFYDKHLSWGAKVSDYSIEILSIENSIPVFIELEVDIDIPKNSILIDHHNQKAGKEELTSLEQIFQLLKLSKEKWTRHYALVSANDKGYIDEMLALHASKEEVSHIRQLEREAQGITDLEEQQAIQSINNAKLYMNGKLLFIECPHSKNSCITDRLHQAGGGIGYENLIILSPTETNFYGETKILLKLHEQYGGWYGGAIDHKNQTSKGYWGVSQPILDILEYCMMH